MTKIKSLITSSSKNQNSLATVKIFKNLNLNLRISTVTYNNGLLCNENVSIKLLPLYLFLNLSRSYCIYWCNKSINTVKLQANFPIRKLKLQLRESRSQFSLSFFFSLDFCSSIITQRWTPIHMIDYCGACNIKEDWQSCSELTQSTIVQQSYSVVKD